MSHKKNILIFGKDFCPFTKRAISDFKTAGYSVNYISIKSMADIPIIFMTNVPRSHTTVPVVFADKCLFKKQKKSADDFIFIGGYSESSKIFNFP